MGKITRAHPPGIIIGWTITRICLTETLAVVILEIGRIDDFPNGCHVESWIAGAGGLVALIIGCAQVERPLAGNISARGSWDHLGSARVLRAPYPGAN